MTESRTEAHSRSNRVWDWIGAHQDADGCWEGEVVWCPMITAQYVIAQRILRRSIDIETRDGIIRYFAAVRLTAGGRVAWGLHPESQPYVFVTTLVYVALRLLGLSPEHALTKPAREWLLEQPGGVAANPTWGKFWLSMIGVYEYSGMNPVPPELFLLPSWAPLHPDKLYCHTRMIYLGIAYLYGRKFRVLLPETADLVRELYLSPYERVDFHASRHELAASDVYIAPTAILRGTFDLLKLLDWMSPAGLRRRALERCRSRIVYEQKASCHLGLSPVNGILNTIALADMKHPDFKSSLAGLEAWRWQDVKGGVRFAGARSNAWDTAFIMEAALEHAPAAAEQRECLRRAYRYLRDTQMIEELQDRGEHGRDAIRGGWCFSDGQHRWPVSDCTAEALSAVLAAHESAGLIAGGDESSVERISDERLAWAADFILARQNADGGFGTYERRRGSGLLENMNPSEMFGDCMTERSYIECTASAVKALARFQRHLPGAISAVPAAIVRACDFLRSSQRDDGSYPGFWGINFTYANLFVVEALREATPAVGDDVPFEANLRRVAEWLIAHQRADGGWGEHHASCLDGVYREHSTSQAVMTAWALLALLQIIGPEPEPVRRGIEWLRSRQGADGSWPQEAVNGVFFGSAMLEYQLYRIYFPAWALARNDRMLEQSEAGRTLGNRRCE